MALVDATVPLKNAFKFAVGIILIATPLCFMAWILYWELYRAHFWHTSITPNTYIVVVVLAFVGAFTTWLGLRLIRSSRGIAESIHSIIPANEREIPLAW